MKNPIDLLKGPAVILFATVVVFLGYGELSPGTFNYTTVGGMIGIPLFLTMVAWVLMVMANLFITVPFGLKNLGVVLHSLVGVAVGTAALMIFALFFPAAAVIGLVGALKFAAMNTALIWVIGYFCEVVKSDELTLWPQRQ